MATVYLAEDLKHARRVAIKVIQPELAVAIGHDRFLREIRIAARLNHPHILPLFDSGTAEDQLYYVMPWIEGESLRARLDREGKLPVEDAIRLACEIASALGHAHQHGIVHRDIKPENILLSEGIALVGDFGIARTTGPASAQAGTSAGTDAATMVGTPSYMSPEQASGEAVDGRTDLYALSCVLYEMLAGRPPFVATTNAGVIRQLLTVEAHPITELRPLVSGGVATAIARGLAKQPADRFGTAAEFAEALVVARRAGPTPPPVSSAVEPARPNNLPRERTRFIGRERELAQCVKLLGETRLLTLTGVGGSGKTRLALRLARTLLDSYKDGAWFVDLAPLADASRVVLTVAAALGIREEPGRPLLESLMRRVAGLHALIVLDNCEHLLGASAELVEGLLGAGEQLVVIVTSREGLGLDEERAVVLRSLAVPAAATAPDHAAIAASEAVRLFVDRARAAAPDFELTEATAPLVGEICRRLDGIPLAIELAAARVRLLSLEEIRSKLDDRFRLLTGGNRSAVPRHQTLRSTLDWSYDHLESDEQRLMRVLAVFTGGWTMKAATAVWGDEGNEFAVLDLLTRLADKSLVVAHTAGGVESRYYYLETVRQYALGKLDEAREGAALRDRHLEAFLALAEETEPRLWEGADQAPLLARLAAEHENFQTALAWSERTDDAQQGLRLAGALWRFWFLHGDYMLARRALADVTARRGAEAPTRARAKALYGAGAWCRFQGDSPAARPLFEQSLEIDRALGNKLGIARSLTGLAWVSGDEGDDDAARSFQEEGLSIYQELGNLRGISSSLCNLGEVAWREGNLESALALNEAGLEYARQAGDREVLSVTLVNLGMLQVRLRDPAGARPRLIEALRLVRDLAASVNMPAIHALEGTAELALAEGDAEAAVRLFGAAKATREIVGSAPEPPEREVQKSLLEHARAALGDADFASAWALGQRLTFEDAVNCAVACLEGSAGPSRL